MLFLNFFSSLAFRFICKFHMKVIIESFFNVKQVLWPEEWVDYCEMGQERCCVICLHVCWPSHVPPKRNEKRGTPCWISSSSKINGVRVEVFVRYFNVLTPEVLELMEF